MEEDLLEFCAGIKVWITRAAGADEFPEEVKKVKNSESLYQENREKARGRGKGSRGSAYEAGAGD